MDVNVLDVRINRYRHADHAEALIENLTLSLKPGERIAITGENGAGKSTLLDLIMGVEPMDQGEVHFKGTRLCPATEGQIYPQIGYLFQNPYAQLFCPTVLDDVMFAPLNQGFAPDQARERALKWLDRLGVAHLAPRDPQTLSGGEAKRVAMAAILAQDPQLLILDEPTAALDAGARQKMCDLLLTLEQSMLIVSHNDTILSSIAIKVLLLENGRLKAI